MLESLSCGHFQLENSSVAIIRNSLDQPIVNGDIRRMELRNEMTTIERKGPAVSTPVQYAFGSLCSASARYESEVGPDVIDHTVYE